MQSALTARLLNSLSCAIRQHIQSFYESGYHCSTSTCSVYVQALPWSRVTGGHVPCPSVHCTGVLTRQRSAHRLYQQLIYFKTLFDVERTTKLFLHKNRTSRYSTHKQLHISTVEFD
jgi:hypothetical protein